MPFATPPPERLSVKDAAEKLGITPAGVRHRMKRGALSGGVDENGKTWVSLEPAPTKATTAEFVEIGSSAASFSASKNGDGSRLMESNEVAAALARLSVDVRDIKALLDSVPDEVFALALAMMKDERDELRLKRDALEQLLDIALRDHSMKLAELRAEVARLSQARRSYGGGLIDDLVRLNAAVKRLRASAPKYRAKAAQAWSTVKLIARRMIRLK